MARKVEKPEGLPAGAEALDTAEAAATAEPADVAEAEAPELAASADAPEATGDAVADDAEQATLEQATDEEAADEEVTVGLGDFFKRIYAVTYSKTVGLIIILVFAVLILFGIVFTQAPSGTWGDA
ncbi:MAG: hypothetical protein FWF28_07155, partial [Micrococcales bacterium]|nr:hypothetical protein [Micrococcales bacterium]